VEPDAALGRSTSVVVLDAKAAENLDLAVVHPHRNREVVLALRPPQKLAETLFELQRVRHGIELLLSHFERVELFGHLNPPSPTRAVYTPVRHPRQPASRSISQSPTHPDKS